MFLIPSNPTITLYENDDSLETLFIHDKIRTESNDLMQILYEGYLKISPPTFDDEDTACELLSPIFKLTDVFLSNNSFLEKTYAILLDIYLHYEYSPSHAYYPIYAWQGRDIYTSIVHLQGLRILNNQEKKDENMGAYKEYFDKFINELRERQQQIDFFTKKILEYHEKHILKDYPEMLIKISKFFSDMKINLSSDDESEDAI